VPGTGIFTAEAPRRTEEDVKREMDLHHGETEDTEEARRACEMANQDADVRAIEAEWDALPEEGLEAWSDGPAE
jgi:hypothetical protein